MARESRFSSNDPAQRLQALSRWDNEGSAIPVGPFVNPASGACGGGLTMLSPVRRATAMPVSIGFGEPIVGNRHGPAA